MSVIVRSTAAELAARIAARELSAVEVTQAHLDRIADCLLYTSPSPRDRS